MTVKLALVDPKTFEIAESGDLGLFVDGRLETTYHSNKIPEEKEIIISMLQEAYKCGERARSREIRKLIG